MASVATPKVGGALAFVSMPLMWLLPTVVVAAGIVLLIPAILFRDGYLGFDYLSALGWFEFLKIAGASLLGALIVAFIPVLGRANSLISLVQAAVVLSFSVSVLTRGSVNVWPDFWTGALLVVSTAVITWVLALLLSFPLTLISGGDESAMQSLSYILGSVLSYIAAAVYGGWIRVENIGP
jgi:hypothetical protein